MNRTPSMLLLGGLLSLFSVRAFAEAEPPLEFKDYQDSVVGVKLKVAKTWQEVTMTESPETGTVAFNIYPVGHVQVSATRRRFESPFAVWLSSDTLLQLFQPGYKTGKAQFAGRSTLHVTGHDLDGRRQEAYYSSRPPFVDDITLVADEDEWERYTPTLVEFKKSIRWLK